MLCAISGEAPQAPVASRKSGNVFEKRLIEAYIQENGKDPVNGEELALDDLVELKTARVVKPRPPTLTSIPSLLSVFQNEWDAMALESYTLKQHLAQLRQELSTALYTNDAATRVIARLTKERDEARDALSKISLRAQRSAGEEGDAMQVDGATMKPEVAARVDETQARLSKSRRKRPVPEGWATVEDLQAFHLTSPIDAVEAGSSALAMSDDRGTAFIGASKKTSKVFAISEQQVIAQIPTKGQVTDVACGTGPDGPLYITSSATGSVDVWRGKDVAFAFKAHAGAATGIAMHPSGDILASVGADKSIVLYDLVEGEQLSQIFTESGLTCCQFHPDGHFLATGGADGQIRAFDVKEGSQMATFDAGTPIKALAFSENGYWLASALRGSASVNIWDIRKEGAAALAKTLDFGSRIDSIAWDYSGQYLAAAGPGAVAVQHYDKGRKAWAEVLSKACSAAAVQWAADAKGLLLLTAKGKLQSLQ